MDKTKFEQAIELQKRIDILQRDIDNCNKLININRDAREVYFNNRYENQFELKFLDGMELLEMNCNRAMKFLKKAQKDFDAL